MIQIQSLQNSCENTNCGHSMVACTLVLSATLTKETWLLPPPLFHSHRTTAINTFNNFEMEGRPIFVREDREDRELKEAGYVSERPVGARERSGGGAGGGGGAPSSIPASSGGFRVFVGNLSWETDWRALKDHMRAAGNVTRADVLSFADTGRSKGASLQASVSSCWCDVLCCSLQASVSSCCVDVLCCRSGCERGLRGRV